MLEELAVNGTCAPSFAVELRKIAKIWTAERRVEQVHSIIKRLGMNRPNSCPAAINAELHEASNIALLRSPASKTFVVKMWWQRDIVGALLMPLGYNKAALRRQSPGDKVKSLFGATLSLLHKRDPFTKREAPKAYSQWTAATHGVRTKEKFGTEEKLVFSYLKDLMVSKEIVCLPTRFVRQMATVSLDKPSPAVMIGQFLDELIKPDATAVVDYVTEMFEHSEAWTVWKVVNVGRGGQVFVNTVHSRSKVPIISVVPCTGPFFIKESSGELGIPAFSAQPQEINLRCLLNSFGLRALVQNLIVFNSSSFPLLAIDDRQQYASRAEAQRAPLCYEQEESSYTLFADMAMAIGDGDSSDGDERTMESRTAVAVREESADALAPVPAPTRISLAPAYGDNISHIVEMMGNRSCNWTYDRAAALLRERESCWNCPLSPPIPCRKEVLELLRTHQRVCVLRLRKQQHATGQKHA